tara:strand:+ start:424 stop:660 length:237 start_codon:yes stop_codon:yes gene_type:complete
MPVYTLKNIQTEEQWDVICSWSELKTSLEDPNLQQVLVPLNIIGNRMGNSDTKVPDGFKDLLKNKIKKGSGRGNTINV